MNNKNKIVDESKKFLLEFFKDSKIKDEDGVLTISEVPNDFEKFVGKNSPYKFVFDVEKHNKIKDSELIMQGSYFLLTIKDYLNEKGQTSLAKIEVRLDKNGINKNPRLSKYKILEINQKTINLLYQFSFLSTYQYLNNKKQSTNNILTLNKEILNLDLDKFKLLKGNKEEIPALDPTEPYKNAKKILEMKVNKEIRPIKMILKEKLEKELFRIKDHYSKQLKEKDEEVETCVNKIKMLQSKLRHTSYDRDISILKRMIRESNERLEMLKKKGYRERLKNEESFHINDEVEKHVLAIKNNLINITVFYYPIYEIEIANKGKKTFIKYDPILDKIV